MGSVADLLDRPLYAFAQVDRILGLKSGTARRWIDGYARGGHSYEPVVRPRSTGDEVVTWGEFVEARLLAEYREAGVPMRRMRPVVERLREEFGTAYPLVSEEFWLAPDARELVWRAQAEANLDPSLAFVYRTGQGVLEWSPEARTFDRSAEWVPRLRGHEIGTLRPVADIEPVKVDPLRSFGEPVVRGVRTDVIAELVRAGDSPAMIAALYELPRDLIDAAVRYELVRLSSAA